MLSNQANNFPFRLLRGANHVSVKDDAFNVPGLGRRLAECPNEIKSPIHP